MKSEAVDNVTHTLTGLFLARAGLNRFEKRATLALLLAANLPDIDIVSAFGGSASYLHWHRNLTHSFVVAPILAVLLTGFFRLIWKNVAAAPIFFVSLAGIASHLLLDVTNIYGIRLLLPFSGEWFRWDLTPVIDPFILTAFALGLAAPALSRLVGGEISQERRAPHPGRGFAIFALLFLAGYNGGRAVLHQKALSLLNTRDFAEFVPVRVAAFPAGLNPLRWRGVVETASSYEIFDISSLQTSVPDTKESLGKAEPSAEIELASATPAFVAMREFAVFPLFHQRPANEDGAAVEVSLSDVRFDFLSRALFDGQRRILRSWFEFAPARARIAK